MVRVTRPGGLVFIGVYGSGGLSNAGLLAGRYAAKAIPYTWTDRILSVALKGKRVPNSFMPAKLSVLDNLYVPIRERYSEREIRHWFSDFDFEEVVRTKTTVFDHTRLANRLIFGHGYLQFRARKPQRG